MLKDSKKIYLPYLLCVLPSFVLLVLFYLGPADNYYPQFDAASYLTTAHKNASSIRSEGIWKLPYYVFVERGERKTATPIPATIALVIVGNDVAKAQAIANLSMFAMLLTYLYLWVSRFLGGIKRIVAFWLISLQPFLFSAATSYMSELPFLTFLIAGLYHVFRCNFFHRKSHAYLAAILLACGICFRPAEGCIVLFLPGLLYVQQALHRNSIKKADVLLGIIAVLAVVVAGITLYLTRHVATNTAPFCAAASALAVVAFTAGIGGRASATSFFRKPFCLLLAIVSAWYLPFLNRSFFGWLRRSANWSLSTYYKLSDPNKDPLDFAVRLYRAYLGDALLLLLIFTACYLVVRFMLGDGRMSASQYAHEESSSNTLNVLFIALFIFPHPLLALFFHNADVRYYILSATVLIFTLVYTFLCLSSHKAYEVLSVAVIVSLALAQLANIGAKWLPYDGQGRRHALLPESQTILPRGNRPSTVPSIRVHRLAEAIHSKVNSLGISELYCTNHPADSSPGYFIAVNFRLRERFNSTNFCRGFSKWSDGPVWPQKCAAALHVFDVGNLNREPANQSELITSVRTAWRKDRMAGMGYTSVEELTICLPDNPNDCSSYLFAIKECSNQGS